MANPADSRVRTKSCKRCSAEDAPLNLRTDPTCKRCYADYIENKVGRRIGVLNREVRAPPEPPRRYLTGLSFGLASGSLVHILDRSIKLASSKQRGPTFELLVVHIESGNGNAEEILAKYRERYPSFTFECVPLSKAICVRTIDWSVLPDLGEGDEMVKLGRLFEGLPSATSKTDMLRLLTRHLLLHIAVERSCSALLLGHTTTALASLTLSAVANGRGFNVPREVSDGLYPVRTYKDGTEGRRDMSIYYPLREIFSHEVSTYAGLAVPLNELLESKEASKSIVSHKDSSIEDVVGRYFANVEGPYAGIVANVVRTAGKLDRPRGEEELCRLCGLALDVTGDSRWAGELGDDAAVDGKLCYGCVRTMKG